MAQFAIVDEILLPRRILYGVLALYAAAFLVFSQTQAFTWDESYHLVAAQLIDAGHRPYIDFCFPQSPLNAYWNAALMRVFGQSWRVAHAAEAAFVLAAVWLMADFLRRHFPVAGWRAAAALFTALAIGLNPKVFLYGPVAQPYGMCLLALALAFRMAIRAANKARVWNAAGSGLFAGAAAASSLLTAAAAPVLLIWITVCSHAGRRWNKALMFCAAALVPFAPVLWLFALGPRQTWFNLVQYHLHYRKLYWPQTTRHDLDVLTSWIDSGPALTLGLLAMAGLIYVARSSRWQGEDKAPFYLCAWLALALAAEVGRAHPTFTQYFLLIAPFAVVLAAAGLYAMTSRLSATGAASDLRWPAILVSSLLLLGLGRALFEDSQNSNWGVYRQLADKVEQVTPRGALLFAEEPIYFLTHRLPPPGFELAYTHILNLPAEDAALFHIIDRAEVRRRVQSEPFATAYSCDDDDVAYYGLKDLYRQNVVMSDCTIFWDRKPGL